MRTTIRMNDELLNACKAAAASSGQTMTAFIEEAIRRQLIMRDTVKQTTPSGVPVFAGDGTLPGVDLDDSAALRDLMENA
ncbi:MAG: CopG family transcriptional regulator [Actinomycetota bacterium]